MLADNDGALMRRFLLCSLTAAAVALPARAGVPDKNDGTVTILAGWRGVPQHGLMSELSREGLDPEHGSFQPGFLLELGFMPDDDLHISIDLGYGLDSWHMGGGDASVKIVNILLAGDTVLAKGKRWTIYLGAGLGYSLNTFTRNGADTESNGSAGFIKCGFRYQLFGSIALVLEDRYTLAWADYPALNSSVNVGGNLLAVGLMFHFNSPQDKGHP
jgi:hypothetical protein